MKRNLFTHFGGFGFDLDPVNYDTAEVAAAWYGPADEKGVIYQDGSCSCGAGKRHAACPHVAAYRTVSRQAAVLAADLQDPADYGRNGALTWERAYGA